MCKLESMKAVFPDGIILNTNRAPHITIPSTISLNNTLYQLFTSKPTNNELNDRTKEVLMDWFLMAEETLNASYSGQHLKIDFKKLIQRDPSEQRAIEKQIGRDLREFLLERKSKGVNHKSKNEYEPITGKEYNEVYERLPFMKGYI